MPLYLGSNKVKVNMGNNLYKINLYSTNIITNGIRLLSLEGYILKDLNGLYLTSKESE